MRVLAFMSLMLAVPSVAAADTTAEYFADVANVDCATAFAAFEATPRENFYEVLSPIRPDSELGYGGQRASVVFFVFGGTNELVLEHGARVAIAAEALVMEGEPVTDDFFRAMQPLQDQLRAEHDLMVCLFPDRAGISEFANAFAAHQTSDRPLREDDPDLALAVDRVVQIFDMIQCMLLSIEALLALDLRSLLNPDTLTEDVFVAAMAANFEECV